MSKGFMGIKRPGRMKRMAARLGVSLQEAEVRASHSSDPSLRAAGALGLRLGKGGDLHRGRARRTVAGRHS